MIFVFDNNLPKCLAHGIRELSSTQLTNHQIFHLTDKFAANTPDAEWIRGLATEKIQVVVVTQDKLNKANEAIILRESGLVVFHLDKGWKDHKYWVKANNLIRWWPSIVEHAERMQGAATFHVKWKYNGKFEQARFK